MFRRTSWNASANVSNVTINDGLLVLGVDPGLADTGYGAVRRLIDKRRASIIRKVVAVLALVEGVAIAVAIGGGWSFA